MTTAVNPQLPYARLNLEVQVGRLRTHESGRGWSVVVDPSDPESAIIDAEGEGLDITQATEVLDRLDNLLGEVKGRQ